MSSRVKAASAHIFWDAVSGGNGSPPQQAQGGGITRQAGVRIELRIHAVDTIFDLPG
jgi:hypothetical protein